MVDMLYAVMLVLMGFMLRRVFALFDRLHDEDKVLHNRITDISTKAVTRGELNGAIDRVISRLDKLEHRLMNGRN